MERGLSIIPKREGIRGRQANKHEHTKQSVTAGRTTDQQWLRLAACASKKQTFRWRDLKLKRARRLRLGFAALC